MDTDGVTYRIGSDEPPSLAVVRAVAELQERSVLELKPLGSQLDPESLDRVLQGSDSASCTFQFGDCEIHVDNREVTVARQS